MILTLDEARAQVPTSLSDEALLSVLEATEAEIEARVPAARTDYLRGGYESLVMAFPVGTISAVVEAWDTSPLTLDTTDYLIDGLLLRRLATGTNPAYYWPSRVKVTYAPSAELSLRKRAQVILVRRDLSVAAGVTSESIGDYSVGYGAASYIDQTEQAFALLGPVMVA